MKKLNLPLSAEQRDSLKAGEMVLLSGVMYTARDAAHKRLIEMLDRGETLPLPLVDQTIYYVGPIPAAPEPCLWQRRPDHQHAHGRLCAAPV